MSLRQVVVLAAVVSALGCREPIKTTHDPKDVKTCGSSAVDCAAGAPAHASATCDGTSCGFACDSGYHPTGAACTANAELTSCGPSGADCVAARPANSSALCNGASCDFACDSGFHRSGTTCAGNGTLTSCGPSGVNCVAALPTNSSATCDGAGCGFDCNPDYHQNPAGTACDADSSVTSCGVAASDCNTEKPENSTATCNGTSCGFACVSGYHTCDNLTCSSNFSTATCGTGCSVCPPELNGYPTCDGTNCGFDCNSDYHRSLAGTACDADTSVSSCGAAASDCNTEQPADSISTCDGTSCAFTCLATFHTCDSRTCSSNSSTETCGTAGCTPCPTKLNGYPTCDGSNCGFGCDGGYHKSLAQTSCDADTSVSSCGAAASDCNTETVVNSTATCSGTSCGFTCNLSYHLSSGACVSNSTFNSCGPSGTNCTGTVVPTNSTAICDGTNCTFQCDTNYCPVSGACVSNQTDPANCGTCGKICEAAAPYCVAGACKANINTHSLVLDGYGLWTVHAFNMSAPWTIEGWWFDGSSEGVERAMWEQLSDTPGWQVRLRGPSGARMWQAIGQDLSLVSQDTWHHYAMTVDSGGTARFYFNGALVRTIADSGYFIAGTHISMGHEGSSGRNEWIGNCDNQRFWTTNLTQTFIQNNKNLVNPTDVTNLVGHFKLDDNTASPTSFSNAVAGSPLTNEALYFDGTPFSSTNKPTLTQ